MKSERQTLYELTYMQNLKKKNLMDIANRSVVARDTGWVKWVKRVKRYTFPVVR